MSVDNQVGSTGTRLPSDTVKTNVFTKFPPVIPMVVIATVLIAGAQFGSTEKLSAAFAWLIFVSVAMADGSGAFDTLTSRYSTNVSGPASADAGGAGHKIPPKK